MPGRAAAVRVAGFCRQSEAALRSLHLPDPFTFSQLHERLERRRGRTIEIIARRLPAQAPRGVWVAGQCCDYIFYDSAITGVHQRLVISHEYGHMMFDDTASPTHLQSLAGVPVPGPAGVVASRLLDVTQPVMDRELRAEVFGTVVLQRVESWSDLPQPTAADPRILAHLIATLEGRVDRWSHLSG